ncbi:MAG: M48 family metalloprotease [Phycisphaeraceae bacterium]|nr:M48 family metalloprotease [Phycisphaeraceae bacterium]
MRSFICVLVAVVLGAALPGCSKNPATGKTSFTLQSWEWERSIALEAGPQFTDEFGGATPDSTAQAYVHEIGENLTRVALEQAYAEVPELPWDYTLLDSEVLNAFALPGGKVYISRGLAVKLENEAQLAGVLGHEVGHVMARHGNQRITKQLGFNLALAGLAVGVGLSDENSSVRQIGQFAVPALAVGGNVVLLSYGRDEEMEADALGMQYMSSLGYDPSGQRQVMEILGRETAGSSRPPEWLSTHPTSETRIRRINDLLRDKYSHTQGSPEFVLGADAYERRMLSRLRALPPAKQQIEQGLLEHPEQWCAVCREELAAR